ncbi:MAG: M50 family metallopeptidase [Armatimonadetes bacterium]|nr:M50 family metallopeptidase [Armatimonadota bacterium]
MTYIMVAMQLYLKLLAAATVEALLLCALSRLLFLAGYRLFGSPRHTTGGWLWHLFRAPGNLVHEMSHAVVLFATGYRVKRVRLSLRDPRGRGEVVVYGRWLRLVPDKWAWALASMSPLVAGIATLLLLMHYLIEPGAVGAFAAPSVGEALVARAFAVLSRIPWSHWPTYVILFLVLSVGSELSPSDRDVRTALPRLAAAAALACMVGAAFYIAPPGAPARTWFDATALPTLRRIITAQELALALCGATSLLLLTPVLLRDALTAQPASQYPRPRKPARTSRPRRSPPARAATSNCPPHGPHKA